MKMTSLYGAGDLPALTKQYRRWAVVAAAVALAGVGICIALCCRVTPSNAQWMELRCVAVFAAAGWVDIYLGAFRLGALRHEREHTERILGLNRETVTGQVTLGKKEQRIAKSITVRLVTVQEQDRTRRLWIDSSRAAPLRQALSGGDTLTLETAGGYVTAVEVRP